MTSSGCGPAPAVTQGLTGLSEDASGVLAAAIAERVSQTLSAAVASLLQGTEQRLLRDLREQCAAVEATVLAALALSPEHTPAGSPGTSGSPSGMLEAVSAPALFAGLGHTDANTAEPPQKGLLCRSRSFVGAAAPADGGSGGLGPALVGKPAFLRCEEGMQKEPSFCSLEGELRQDPIADLEGDQQELAGRWAILALRRAESFFRGGGVPQSGSSTPATAPPMADDASGMVPSSGPVSAPSPFGLRTGGVAGIAPKDVNIGSAGVAGLDSGTFQPHVGHGAFGIRAWGVLPWPAQVGAPAPEPGPDGPLGLPLLQHACTGLLSLGCLSCLAAAILAAAGLSGQMGGDLTGADVESSRMRRVSLFLWLLEFLFALGGLLCVPGLVQMSRIDAMSYLSHILPAQQQAEAAKAWNRASLCRAGAHLGFWMSTIAAHCLAVRNTSQDDQPLVGGRAGAVLRSLLFASSSGILVTTMYCLLYVCSIVWSCLDSFGFLAISGDKDLDLMSDWRTLKAFVSIMLQRCEAAFLALLVVIPLATLTAVMPPIEAQAAEFEDFWVLGIASPMVLMALNVLSKIAGVSRRHKLVLALIDEISYSWSLNERIYMMMSIINSEPLFCIKEAMVTGSDFLKASHLVLAAVFLAATRTLL
mmetsp:Transcript_91010/g.283551  ORF Transcript_91010/g.283551 Transcript_91010/m.283551 type:complete len:646 (-) Transcript_91010:67-2004(-)